MKFATRAVHAGQAPDPATGAVIPPIHPSATFVQEAPGKPGKYEYSRTQNPTREALETCLASLEGGSRACAFASGSAASETVLHLLEPGDHVVAGDDLYGGTVRLFRNVFEPLGIAFDMVDAGDAGTLRAALRESTRLIWIETPSNPLLKIVDIASASEAARESEAWLVVDNTFATPYLQKPLALGADIVVESTTKYLGGHSDLVGGACITKDPALGDRIAFFQNAVGAVPSPFDAWLLLRGIKTLPLRMDRHCDNAERVADFLASRPEVKHVHYPGRPDHPGREIAKGQMTRFGGMVSFELAGGENAAREFASRTGLFLLAESLGGVESLIEHPASMTHAGLSEEERVKSGLSDGLIRLSVGIEDGRDLIRDLEQAFAGLGKG